MCYPIDYFDCLNCMLYGTSCLQNLFSNSQVLIGLIGVILSIIGILLTYFAYRLGNINYVTGLLVNFQDAWHDPRSILMRGHLHSKEFFNAFENAINKTYCKDFEINKKTIEESIGSLLVEKLKTNNKEIFENELKLCFPNPTDPDKTLFNTLQALTEVLLLFDRLAVFREEPMMLKRCIDKYKPPIKGLAPQMQAFIAVYMIRLREDEKNYKRDYMHMLGMLSIQNIPLFDYCKRGLFIKEKPSKEEKKENKKWKHLQKRKIKLDKRKRN